MVKVISSPSKWLLPTIYASTNYDGRIRLWDYLVDIASIFKDSWLVGGDFNEILKSRDKFKGERINCNRNNNFWNFLNRCKLVDLGFIGSKYTWTNKRYSRRQDLILKRLDRCFGTDNCIWFIP